MANIPSKQDAFFNLPLSIQRLNAIPNDSTAVWFSLADAEAYAASGATAYVGQIISVLNFKTEGDTQTLNTVDVYKIDVGGVLSPIKGGGSAVIRAAAPTTGDRLDSSGRPYDIGTHWLDTTDHGRLYILKDITDTIATWKILATSDELAEMGAGDMYRSDYAVQNPETGGYLNVVKEAAKVVNALTIGTKKYDGSTAIEVAVADLQAMGLLTAGTLPTAGSANLGAVKVDGNGLSITGGLIKVVANGNGIIVGADGKLGLIAGDGIDTSNGNISVRFDASTLEVDASGVLKVKQSVLSDNNFTDEYKNKIDNIAGGATKVVAGASNGQIAVTTSTSGTESTSQITVYTHPTETAIGTGTLGHMTTEERNKLSGLSNYTLPPATLSTLGGVIIGTGLAVATEGADAGSVSLVTGSINSIGGVKSSTLENYITIAADGTMTVASLNANKIVGVVAEASRTTGSLSFGGKSFNGSVDTALTAADIDALTVETLPISTKDDLGVVKIGDNINVAADGTISVTFPDPYKLPTASSTTLGGVKIGSGINVTPDGTISVSEFILSTASESMLGGVKSSLAQDKISVDIATGIMTVNSISAGKIVGDVAKAQLADTAAGYTVGGAIDSKFNEMVTKVQLFYQEGIEIGKIRSDLLPSYVDDVISGTYNEVDDTFSVNNVVLTSPESGKIYYDTTTGRTYRYTGTGFIFIGNPLDYATESEAIAGNDNTKVMTPVRVKQSIAASNINVNKLVISDGDTLIFDCGGASD